MNSHRSIAHEEAIELLPWLVNGAMEESEQREVQAHTRTCVICRRELDALEQLQAIVARQAHPDPVPAPDMRAINARIDAAVERQQRWGGLSARLREMCSSPWRLAFAAQSALVVVLAAALIWPEAPEPEFTTLTQPQALPDGPYVRAVFSPDLRVKQLAGLLGETGLSIADGPSPRGVYTLKAAEGLSEADSTRLLNELQRRDGVLFAQWASQPGK